MSNSEEWVEYFVNCIKLGRDCEIVKQELNNISNFEPYSVFTRIDRLSKGYLDIEDIINFLKDNDYYLPTTDSNNLNLFMQYYDRDFDNKLNFSEFLIFILNKSHPLLRAVSTQRKTFKVYHWEFLSSELEKLISLLIMKEVNLFEWANKKKLEIFMSRVDLLELFITIDKDKNGFLCFYDFDLFLRENGVILYKEEIKTLISLFDEDLDKKLNWNEFLFMVLPSKLTFDYDYALLRELENQHMKIYYDSLRREKMKMDSIQVDYAIDPLDPIDPIDPIEPLDKHERNLIDSDNEINMLEKKLNYYNKYSDLNSLNNFYKTNKSVDNSAHTLSETRDFTPQRKEHQHTLQDFLNDLFDLLNIDVKIENLKLKLSRLDFNLVSCFKIFTKNKKDYITFDMMIEGFEFFNIFLSRKQAELIFKKLDRQIKGKINYSHFIELFIPKDSQDAILMTSKKPSKNIYDFDYEVKETINMILESIIQAEEYFQELKSKYSRLDLNYLFERLDRDNNGFISLNEVRLKLKY